jgi:hypothetical protein
LALWIATRQQSEIRFSEGVESQLREEESDDTQLPIVYTESKPREIEPDPIVDSDENQLAGAPSSGKTPESPRSSPSPRADAATPGAPTMTSEQDEQRKTMAFLEARLIQIAAELSSLEVAYRVFAQACQSPRPDGETDDKWLVGLKRGPDTAVVTGIPLNNRRESFDCVGSWEDLMSRVRDLKTGLDETADLARRNRVLPGDWRKLLASHRLNDLQEL